MHTSTDTSESPPQRWPSKINTAALGIRADSRRNFLIIAALSLLLIAGACFCFSVQYQTNDDVGMNLYAAGKGLGQHPSEFLLFQHFLIGLALKFLYTSLPAFPWYGTLTYLYLLVSSLTVGYVISRLNPRLSAVGLWLVAFVLFYLEVIVSPQFTICAGYLAIAGTLLLFAAAVKPYPTRKGNLYALMIGSALLILAGLIRFQSLVLVLLLMSPLYGYALVSHSAGMFRRLAPALCCVLLISALLQWGQQAYYKHSSGWEQFYRYNNVRADFNDRHKIVWNKSTEPFFRQIGWSQNDLAMLISWFYVDQKVYSLQNLLFISQNTSLSPRSEVVWRKLLFDLGRPFLSYAGIATSVLFVLLLITSVGITRWFSFLALLWYSGVFFGINIIERHLPYHVWLVMLFALYTMQLTLWCQTSEEGPRRRSVNERLTSGIPFALVAVSCAICCVGQIKAVSELSATQQYLQKRFRDDMARLQPRVNQLFVTWGGDFPYEEYQLPTQAAPVTSNMQILGLGVGNHEPFVQNRLKSFGIDDLYQAFYTRDDVFLICGMRMTKFLRQYIWEHYHTSVEIRTVFQGTRFAVHQVTQYFCNGSGSPATSGQRYVLATATSTDFNHDGKPDYVLYNGGTHQTAVWHMDYNIFLSSVFAPTLPPGWNVIGVADFNGDGDLDYALFNPGTHQTAIWYLSGVTFAGGAFGPTLPSSWTLVATTAFDFDCRPDYVLYNASTRQTAVWYMHNNVFADGAFGPTLPAGWRLAGVADFNGDGKRDYLLFNASTRQTAIWYLSGVTFVSSAYGPPLPSGWALTGTADFNGDGKPDYVLYNSSSRQTAIWYMNNNVLLTGAFGPILPPAWNLVAP